MRQNGRGLPKVYLRMDPNIDQHPDLEGMVLLMCAAHRQHPRGRFRRETARRVLGGQRRLDTFTRPKPGKVTPDLVEQPDGTLYLDGWDEWQEGDLTVRERVSRIRNKRYNTVTSAVTPPLPDRYSTDHPVAVAVAVASTGTESPAGGDKKRPRRRRPFDPQDKRTPQLATDLVRLFNGIARAWSRDHREAESPGVMRAVDGALVEGYRPDQLMRATAATISDEWYFAPGRGLLLILSYTARPRRGGGLTKAHLPSLLGQALRRSPELDEKLRSEGIDPDTLPWDVAC